MSDLDTGNLLESLGQCGRLVAMSRDGFGNDLDLHSTERLGSLYEPLHFLHLLFFRERGGLEFLINPLFGGCLICVSLRRSKSRSPNNQRHRRHPGKPVNGS